MESPTPIDQYANRDELSRHATSGRLMPIGQFAAAARLSLKALRLYDQSGLLPARYVDPDSGYRFYAFEQLRGATLIGLLRRIDMPLTEIRAVLDDPAAGRLDEYEASLEAAHARRKTVLSYVRLYLTEDRMFEVKTKKIEPQSYVSRSTRTQLGGLEPFITETIDDLMKEQIPAGPPFAIFHGQVNETDDGPVEVGLPAATGDKQLPGGELAYTVVSGPACTFPEIIGAYDAVAAWAKANGRDLIGAPREVYLEPQAWEIAWLID